MVVDRLHGGCAILGCGLSVSKEQRIRVVVWTSGVEIRHSSWRFVRWEFVLARLANGFHVTSEHRDRNDCGATLGRDSVTHRFLVGQDLCVWIAVLRRSSESSS